MVRSPIKIQQSKGARLAAFFGTALAAVFAAANVTVVIAVLRFGGSYYWVDHAERMLDPRHELLRPGGPVGLLLGIYGTVLMVAMLSYTVRKWLGRLPLGPVPAWLRFHMICGVMGPTFIVIHGGLELPAGLIAVAFWCMVLVALSGLFGRYVYGFFPRNAAGVLDDLGAARARLADLRADWVARTTEADADAIGEAVAIAQHHDRSVRGLLDLFRLRVDGWRRRRRISRRLGHAGLTHADLVAARATLFEQLAMKESLETWETASRLFRYWHLFHLPLAKAMYTIVAIHVGTALLFGGVFVTILRFLS